MDSNSQTLKKGAVIRGGVYTYTIEKVLGQGSFGITYLASTQMSGPLGSVRVYVAIKEFFAEWIDSRDMDGAVMPRTINGVTDYYCRSFGLEAESILKIKHSGIVGILESFESQNTYYYSMEYLPGGSLEDKVRNLGMPENVALQYIMMIGEALSVLHKNNILHLDIKPANIMLSGDGSPVIIDFGLSKMFYSTGEPESLTSIGQGTLGFSPLEQMVPICGKALKPTSDIYALGATLYEMLTGIVPPNALEILNDGFPSELLYRRSISDTTVRAINKAMSPAMRDRPQSIEEFLSSLRDVDEATMNPFPFMALRKGTILNKGEYEIVGFIGQDYDRITYLAERSPSRIKVVIREFFPSNSARLAKTGDVVDDSMSKRKRDEYNLLCEAFVWGAQLLANLEHPNIVKVYDVFTEKGTAYYAMDYYPGSSLEQKVEASGPLSECAAEQVIRQIADAVFFFHQHNIVSLDVEPSHIFLNSKGDAVLISPCPVRNIGDEKVDEDAYIEAPYRPQYPYYGQEYPNNHRPSADVYSLGATLYYLLSGVIPPTVNEMINGGLKKPEAISGRIWRAIEQAMRINPKNRPQSVGDFLSLINDGDSGY